MPPLLSSSYSGFNSAAGALLFISSFRSSRSYKSESLASPCFRFFFFCFFFLPVASGILAASYFSGVEGLASLASSSSESDNLIESAEVIRREKYEEDWGLLTFGKYWTWQGARLNLRILRAPLAGSKCGGLACVSGGETYL